MFTATRRPTDEELKHDMPPWKIALYVLLSLLMIGIGIFAAAHTPAKDRIPSVNPGFAVIQPTATHGGIVLNSPALP